MDEMMMEEDQAVVATPRSALRRVIIVVFMVFAIRVMILGSVVAEAYNMVAPRIVMSVCPGFSVKDFRRIPTYCGMIIVLVMFLIFGRGEVRV